MKMFVSICFLFLLFQSGFCNLFESPYNHYSENKINEIAILGERCSGTKFMDEFMMHNFPSCQVWSGKYMHKHYCPWMNLEEFNLMSVDEDLSYLQSSDNCLYILIVRNIHDWLRSLYLLPHDIPGNLIEGGFFYFISSEWVMVIHEDRLNPYMGRPFLNVLELRKFKMLNYLEIGKRVKNFLVVRHEDVNDNREDFIKYVSEKYQLEAGDFWNGEPYVKKEYFLFSSPELRFINGNVDWGVERLVGYSQRTYSLFKVFPQYLLHRKGNAPQ